MVKKEKKYTKKIDFKNHKLGLYDVETFIKDWGNEPKRGVAEKRCKIIKKKGKKALEITIPKGTTSKGGSFWRLKFPRTFTEATFEYDVMFGDNFDFVRGGKMPGLGGGESKGSGGTAKQYQNGFSARLMWREIDLEKEGEIKEPLGKEMKVLKEMIKSGKKKEDLLNQMNAVSNEVIKLGWMFRDLVKEPHKAYLVQYMYYPDKEGRYGENLYYKRGNKKLFVEPNKWYKIKMKVRLSEDPKKIDRVWAWVNGRKVLDEKRNLRKKKSYGIDQVMFSLFFGGNDETWKTSKDEKVYFKNFKVEGV